MHILVVNGNLAFTDTRIMLGWLDRNYPGWTWDGFEDNTKAITFLVNNPGLHKCLNLPGGLVGTISVHPLFRSVDYPYTESTITLSYQDAPTRHPIPPLPE